MAKNDKICIVACKLPHGITIEHPMDPNDKVTLTGLNDVKIVGATYGVTRVDSEFMEQWIAFNADFAPVKSGAIFIAKDDSDLVAKAVEREKLKTGFEPMRTDGKDERAAGAKTANAKD